METADYNASADQIAMWEKLTGLPFDVAAMDATTSLVCPACNAIQTVPWVSGTVAQDGGKGFAENGFATKCHGCKLLINEDTLATRKFVRDLIAFQEAEQSTLA